MLQPHLSELGLHLQNQAMGFEAASRKEHSITTAQQSAERGANVVMNDSREYDNQLAQQVGGINALNVDGDEKEKLALHAKAVLSHAAVMHDIQADPYGAMTALTSKEQKGYYGDLTSEQRTALFGHADAMLHQRVADAEHVHRMAKEEQKDASDNLLKQGIVMSQKGQLTPQWVMGHVHTLEPAALKYLLDETSGKATVSDLHTYSDLLTRANHGEDVGTDAQAALFGGQLSKEDYTRISDMSAKDLPNRFKQGDEKIRTALQTSQFEVDPARSQSLANARDDFIDYMRENPKATPQEVNEHTDQIIRRYQIVQATQSTLLLPVPDHFVGTRVAPDIQASKDWLYKDFKEGKINEEVFNREALKLHDWERAQLYMEQQAAEAKKRKAEKGK